MNKNVTQILFSIISSALTTSPLSESVKAEIDEKMISQLYEIASLHDLAHIVGYVLDKEGLLANVCAAEALKKSTYLAVYRYKQFEYELSVIKKTLEKEKIDFITLKGSVLRKYYPAPWMRTSCDIDILCREEDIPRAVDALVADARYEASKKSDYHDVSLRAKSGVHLELHFNIKENMKSIDGVLEKVWDFAVLNENEHSYAQTPEFFVLHHIAHMSYHFLHGGCGIRPFIDLYIIEKNIETNKEVLDGLLEEAGLLRFYTVSKSLSFAWLEGKAMTDTLLCMQEFLLSGGVYGTRKNRIAVQQPKKGGGFKYFCSKLIVPYDVLKSQYPVLKKHRWLMPFMQVCRWFRLLFAGKAKKTIEEMKISSSITESESEEMKAFLDEIGL